MELEHVISHLGSPESRPGLSLHWEQAQRAMPAGELRFLRSPFVQAACRAAYLPPPIIDAAVGTARRVAAQPALRALAWYGVYCHYHCAQYPTRSADQWPPLHNALAGDAHMFYLLVLLAGAPRMRACHRAHRLPESVVRETMGMVLHRMGEYRAEHGVWGLDSHGCRWLSNYMRGDIYAFGRLVHQFGQFDHELRVYRHNASGQVITLSEDGVRYRDDGQLLKSDENDSDVWTARLEVAPGQIRGCAILPSGRALRRPVTLDGRKWKMVLGQSDPVLVFHIPGGTPMRLEPCLESMRAALDFYPRYFPERPFRSFSTKSWVLDAQLEEMLSPQSNLVRFQKHAYLFPIRLTDRTTVKAVFGTEQPSCDRPTTSLERAILDRLAAGPALRARAGGCFVLPEEVRSGRGYHEEVFPWSLTREPPPS